MSRTQIKQYNYNGLVGCVSQRKVRTTKNVVGIYHAEQAGIDVDAPWITLCEKHGFFIEHTTLSLANDFASDPLEWCEGCQKELKAR